MIGVRVGQARDATTLAVVDIERRPYEGREEAYYLVRLLERLPAGATWPDLARRLSTIVAGVQGRGVQPSVRADVTTAPASIDVIRPVGPAVHGVTMASADKARLVSRLQMLLQTGRILLPTTPDAVALAEDLRGYELTPAQAADEVAAPFAVGRHDDMITALGLAVEREPREKPTLVW